MIKGMEEAGVDHEALLDTYIRATNLCTEGRPADLNIGLHMCRGNYKGTHFAEGGYARIAKKVFNEVDVDTFYVCISLLGYCLLMPILVAGIRYKSRRRLYSPPIPSFEQGCGAWSRHDQVTEGKYFYCPLVSLMNFMR